MPESEQKNAIEVHSSESGQKLLQFLMRRLSLPQTLLHRWIRTGQVRINAGRAKPFMLVSTGDIVRLPPFALSMASSATFDKKVPQESSKKHSPTNNSADTPSLKQSSAPLLHFAKALPLPPSVYADDALCIYNKASGMPVHGGTGHTDSLTARLENHFSTAPFKPTPAHRLDKDTSGLLCVAFSYTMLRALQDAFASRTIGKEYLAWVHGSWPYDTPRKLKHVVDKKHVGNMEKMHVITSDEEGKEAVSIVSCVQRTAQHSLMHIRLMTGRTHQIRLQLAAEGCPIVGDTKYTALPKKHIQDAKTNTKLYLHSMRITLPQEERLAHLTGKSFAALPPWEKPFQVDTLPPPLPATDD